MPIPYSKPYRDVQGQIELLQQRGMVISDQTKAQAYLERLGYYRLSGYWYPFRTSDQVVDDNGKPATRVNDQFRMGTEFSHIVDLYVFDKKLRLLVLDAIERIEVCLRVDISLLLGARGPFAHRDPTQLDGKFTIVPPNKQSKHQEWLERLDKNEDRSKQEFVKAFRQKYTSDLPIWMSIELWDFGILSNFYAGMKNADRGVISNRYGVNVLIFETWLRSINYLRNICAHHARLWNCAVVDQPKMPSIGTIPDLNHVILNPTSRFRIYAIIALMQHLLRRINPTSTWGKRLASHIDTLPIIEPISIQNAGFPANWKDEALWR
jgi:abortive infection bacteriophage resistance protein